MKYIDAEKFKKILTSRIELLEEGRPSNWITGIIGKKSIEIYRGLINLVDSLQQEQPDFPTIDEQIKEFLTTHPKIEVPEKYKNPDWLFKKQEQQEVEFEIGKYMTTNLLKKRNHSTGIFHLTQKDYAAIAHHFWNKGYNARKEE